MSARTLQTPSDPMPPRDGATRPDLLAGPKARIATAEGLYVQFGCGWEHAPEGWLNFDASPTLWFERLPILGRLYTKNRVRFPANVRYGDIVRGLPVPDRSCAGVYCSHVLEHLSRRAFDKAISEVWRILAPGGEFRLVVPDLEHFGRRYVRDLDEGRADANDRFMAATFLGRRSTPQGVLGRMSDLFGLSHHLWMWDYPSLQGALTRAGFVEVRRAGYHDSADHNFHVVELPDRFENACAVSARRPTS